jgi:hypothetical protein
MDYYKNKNGQGMAHCKTEDMKDVCEVQKVRRGKQWDNFHTCPPQLTLWGRRKMKGKNFSILKNDLF